jgi:hypothetical protein
MFMVDVCIYEAGFYLFYSPIAYYFPATDGARGFWVILGLMFIGLIVWTAIWVVRQKNRSLWWVSFLLLPFGFVALLVLGNRSERQGSNVQGVNKLGWRMG